MQDKASAQVNAKNVTTADFSVWMSNLPAKANSDDELRKYAEHYGEVVAAFHVRRMGNVLNLNNQVEEAERHLAETKALSQEPGGFFDMMYRRYICGLFAGADAAAEKLEVRPELLHSCHACMNGAAAEWGYGFSVCERLLFLVLLGVLSITY